MLSVDAVVLMAGSGTRMHDITRGRSKLLLHVYDRSLASQACRWLMDCGVRRVVAVTSPRDFADLYPHLEDIGPADVEFALQREPTGTADALALGLPSTTTEFVVCMFADNIFGSGLDARALEGLADHQDLRTFVRWTSEGLDELAVMVPDPGRTTLLRKPHTMHAGLAVTGLFLVRRSAFEAFHQRSPQDGDRERDLLDFVDDALTRDAVDVRQLEAPWIDATSSVESLWRAGNLVRDAVRTPREDAM